MNIAYFEVKTIGSSNRLVSIGIRVEADKIVDSGSSFELVSRLRIFCLSQKNLKK